MNTEKISTPIAYKSKRNSKSRRSIYYVFLLTVVLLAASTALIRAVSIPVTGGNTNVYHQNAADPELSVARRFDAARLEEKELVALSANPELSLVHRFKAGGITGKELAFLSINPELSLARRIAASLSKHSDVYKEWLIYSNNPELMIAHR